MVISNMNLQDLIEAVQMQSDEFRWYYDIEKIELVMATDETGDDFPSFEDMDLDHYISLPSQFDINEYKIMIDFAHTQEEEIALILLDKLHGKGAFGKFKDAVWHLEIRDEWFHFRDKAYEKSIRQWLTLHDIEVK